MPSRSRPQPDPRLTSPSFTRCNAPPLYNSIANFGMSGKGDRNSQPTIRIPPSPLPFHCRQRRCGARAINWSSPYQPLDYPLYGRVLDLQDVRPDLVGTQVVALSGNRQKLTVADEVINLSGSSRMMAPIRPGMPLKPGDVVTLTSPSPLPLNPDFSVPDWSFVPGTFTLFVEDASGRSGTVVSIAGATLTDFELALSGSSDPEVSEYALVTSVISNAIAPYPHTRLLLQNNLINCYDRNSHYRECQRRPGHQRPIGERDHGQRQRFYAQPILHLETVSLDLRLRTHPLRQAKHAAGHRQRSHLDRGAQPLRSKALRSKVFATLNQTRRCHRGSFRRWRGSRNAAHRTKQYPGQLPDWNGLVPRQCLATANAMAPP